MSSLPNPDKPISRRDFLKIAAEVTAGTILTACAPEATTPPTATPTPEPSPTHPPDPTSTQPPTETPTPPPSPTPTFTELEGIIKSQEQISQTATAMSPDTARSILASEAAPGEVIERSLQLILTLNDDKIKTATGFIIETMDIQDKKFALIATAGHTFLKDPNQSPSQELEFSSILAFQPDSNSLPLLNPFESPPYTTAFIYNESQPPKDFGLLLVEVFPYIDFLPISISNTPLLQNSGKLFGLGYPSSTDNFTQSIPYIISPDQIQPHYSTDYIALDPTSSPGGSGTALLTENSELAAIIIAMPRDPTTSIALPIPQEFTSLKQQAYDKMTQKLSSPTPTLSP